MSKFKEQAEQLIENDGLCYFVHNCEDCVVDTVIKCTPEIALEKAKEYLKNNG